MQQLVSGSSAAVGVSSMSGFLVLVCAIMHSMPCLVDSVRTTATILLVSYKCNSHVMQK